MVVPTDYNFSYVTIEPYKTADRNYDGNYREDVPIRTNKPTVRIKARISFGNADKQRDRSEATNEHFKGFILFRTVDLLLAAYNPQSGDHLTKMISYNGEVGVNLYLEDPKDLTHYASRPELVKAKLMDRNPRQ